MKRKTMKRLLRVMLCFIFIVSLLGTGSMPVYAEDTTAPVLTEAFVDRTSDTNAIVGFSTSEPGTYFYEVVEDGASAPTAVTSGAGTVCLAALNVITNPVGMTAGDKDIYIWVKDAADNVSDALKMDIGAYDPSAVTLPVTPAPVVTAGTVTRTSDTEASVKFTTDALGSYYYEIVDDGALVPVIDTSGAGYTTILSENIITNPTGLTAGAKDIYIQVKNLGGILSAVIKMDIDAYVPAPPSDYTITDNGDGTCSITGYTGEGGDVTIPSTINGLTVTKIGDSAFCANYNIENISIPSGVTRIGRDAFGYCNLIQTVKLPDTLESIEYGAFAYCGGLDVIVLPDGLETIGNSAFIGCRGLRSLVIPSSVTSIGHAAFAGLDHVPPTVMDIPYAIFEGDAPTMNDYVFYMAADNFTIYYPEGASGYTSPLWEGYSAIAYDPSATHTLNYDANGGSAGFIPVHGLHTGDLVTIQNDANLSKEGYLFSGWNTVADGSGVTYAVGDAFSMGIDDITLYAQWQSPYTITIEPLEGGSISCDVASAYKGATFTLTITADAGWQYIPDSLIISETMSGPPMKIGQRKSGGSTVLNFVMPSSDIFVRAEFIMGDFTYESISDKEIIITGYIGDGGDVVIPSTIDGKTVSALDEYTFIFNTSVNSVRIPKTVIGLAPYAIMECINLSEVYFEGDAPDIGEGDNIVSVASDFTVYYYVGSTGFTSPTWNGYDSVALPRPIPKVTFDKNGGSTEADPTANTANAEGTVALPIAPTRIGYTFTGWNTVKDGSGMAFTSTTLVTEDTTVYAQWKVIASGGSSHSSSSSSSTSQSTTKTMTPVANQLATAVQPPSGTNNPESTGTAMATAQRDTSGKSVAAFTQSQIKEAIAQATSGMAGQGIEGEPRVAIHIQAPADATTIAANLPGAALREIINSQTEAVTIASPLASVTFDKAAAKTIGGAADGDIAITVSKVNTAGLSATVRQVVGDRPVYDFSVTNGTQAVSEFGGKATVAVPYRPQVGEDANAIVIYYINAEGQPEAVSNCSYDLATQTVSFTTNHFSQYMVGYNKVTFGDVAEDAWYAEAVGFIAARGIIDCNEDGLCNPDAELSRGDFMVMLMKAYGIDPESNDADNFSDAGDTYYTGYLAAAKRWGLSNGIGDNCYGPDRVVTRQEMFTMLYKSLQTLNELPSTTNEKALNAFGDSHDVAPWATEAMTLFVKSGTVKGSDGQLLPMQSVSKAEMAQVLYALLSK
ncbi:MAG: leucine-rich repeat protein [Clostridia bacterium]|nr:leucine-rich repeat protein [Clostridia bacterium]